MDINEIRLKLLLEVFDLLANTSPKEGTFCDTYNECLRRIRHIADTLEEDIEAAGETR